MSLTNEQYDSIIREYDEIQGRNRHLSEERIDKINKELPGLKALDNRIATLTVQQVKASLSGSASSAEDIRDEIAMIKVQRLALLESAGYSEADLGPIYTCADCHDTGYLVGSDAPKRKCHCFRRREIAILYNQSGIGQLLESENFSKLSFEKREGEDLSRLQTAVSVCRDFIATFDKEYRNLVFCGTVGTGKSFLSCCIAYELLKSYHSVLYLSSQKLFDLLAKHQFGNRDGEKVSVDELYACDLLIIDDLGTELTNSFVASSLFDLVNERHLHKKASIISTNLDLEDIRDRYSDRVLSRLVGSYNFIKLTGQDLRKI